MCAMSPVILKISTQIQRGKRGRQLFEAYWSRSEFTFVGRTLQYIRPVDVRRSLIDTGQVC